MKQSFTRLFATVAILWTGIATALPTVTDTDNDLPPIWQKVAPEHRLDLVSVAKYSGLRKLAERIYGMEISGQVKVRDLMMQENSVENAVVAMIKGAGEIQRGPYPKFTDKGEVYVAVGVTWETVYETIEKAVEESENGDLLAVVRREKKVDRKLIDALGMAAIPDSDGYKRATALRAAELDAFRAMAEKVCGLTVASNTQVAHHMIKSDKVDASVVAFLKGVKPVAIRFNPDNSCEVDVQLKWREVVETISYCLREYAGDPVTVEQIYERNTHVNDTYIRVTGSGAPMNDYTPFPRTAADAADTNSLYREERVIIKRVISSGVVVE